MIKLSERLFKIVSFVEPGNRIIDVGTDHGYIPVFLAENGLSDDILATDINEKPLLKAVNNVKSSGFSDKVRFQLTDGLTDVQPHSADKIIIAGMGGETIISILENAVWTCSSGVRLILQPQSKINELISWIRDNGYYIYDSALVKDDGRIYMILAVEKSNGKDWADVFDILKRNKDPLLPQYLDALIRKYSRMVKGMRAGKSEPDELKTAVCRLELFKKMREAEK